MGVMLLRHLPPTSDQCELAQGQKPLDLPNVVLVPDLARLLHCSPKAIRSRVAAGTVPKPFKLGKALAWTAQVIGAWLLDRSRSATQADHVHITITNYTHTDANGLQAIWKMQHPTQARELKTTAIVPKGMNRAQAQAWAQGQIGTILPKLLAKAGMAAEVPTRSEQPSTPTTTTAPTFRDFVEERFVPEYAAQWKPSTRDIYTRTMRDHLMPFFGPIPLSAIDEDLISRFRGKLMKFAPGFRNLLLSKLRKVLDFALELKKIKTAPPIKRFKNPRKDLVTFDADEIERLIRAAEEAGPVHHLIILLALDLGMRVGEICALKWEDVNWKDGSVTIRRTIYQGEEQTPKGQVGTLSLSKALRAALEEHRKREPIGTLVLYRRKGRSSEWHPFNQRAIDHLIRETETIAGLKQTGAHFLRHCSITNAANLGSLTTEIQAHARHSMLSTTENYLHQCGLVRSRSVSDRLDAAREIGSKKVQKRVQTDKTGRSVAHTGSSG